MALWSLGKLFEHGGHVELRVCRGRGLETYELVERASSSRTQNLFFRYAPIAGASGFTSGPK